jgi:putative ABC transport system ATP-binding protein
MNLDPPTDASLTTRLTRAVTRPAHDQVVIRAEAVSYWYGEEPIRTQVLFDNTLEISRGEIVIMTGPSGSGKSTLLTLIGALRSMQQGSLIVLGRDLSRLTPAGQVELRKQIGFIFQQHNLFSSLTAIENVRVAAALAPGSFAELQQRSMEMLAQLGIEDHRDKLPSQLSGGQKQRVAIARALVNRPHLVLADEPTASLDAQAGKTVMELLRKRTREPEPTTILLVTHDQRVLEYADRIVSMVEGRIVTNSLTRIAVRICRALASSEILRGLSETTLSRLAGLMTVETRQAGETIVRQGEEGDRFYIIGSGVADSLKDGRFEEELCFGEVFGMISSYFHRKIPSTVVARTPMELYVLQKDDFLKALAADATFEDRIRNALMTGTTKVVEAASP